MFFQGGVITFGINLLQKTWTDVFCSQNKPVKIESPPAKPKSKGKERRPTLEVAIDIATTTEPIAKIEPIKYEAM